MDFVRHDIERVSRSRTAAYYFLSDNRRLLRIPPNQDVRVVDLYDNSKYGAAAERLPREVVLEYAWQEEVILANDPQNKLDFGQWNGKTFNLDCGGTLVFDGRGNLMSWFRKPGTQHLTEDRKQVIMERRKAWKDNPKLAKEQKVRPPTELEKAELADLEIGGQRKAEMLEYLSAIVRRGLVGTSMTDSPYSDGMRPVTAIEEAGMVRFETTPHLREGDFDKKEAGWTTNY
jgi:hypothetical protein